MRLTLDYNFFLRVPQVKVVRFPAIYPDLDRETVLELHSLFVEKGAYVALEVAPDLGIALCTFTLKGLIHHVSHSERPL